MPSPSSSLATLRPDLAQSLQQFDLAMDQQGFIALDVCPQIDVPEGAGNYGVIPIEQLLQSPDATRAPGSGYNRGRWTFKPDTYATIEHGWEEPIDDNEANLYRHYFDAEMVSASRAYDVVLRSMEQRVANLLFDTTVFTGALTGAAAVAWSSPKTSTPIDDVEAAVQAVFANSGLWPTSLVLSRIAFRNLRLSAQVQDKVKYSGFVDTRAKEVTKQVLADLFDLQEIIVGGSAKNTANEGQAASISGIWPATKAMVCRIDRSTDFRRPTVARCFHWDQDGSQVSGTVETYRDERVRGDVVRVRNQTQEKIIYKQAGYLITGM